MTELQYALKTTYQLQIEVLSPVHIGDGTELIRDIDFVTRADRTYVIDHEQFLAWAFDRYSDDNWMAARPGDVLRNEDLPSLLANTAIFRYLMSGVSEKSQLHSHIKDVYGRAYIPGSSLKGLLRTVFIWGLYVADNKTPDLRRLNRSRSWAAQPIEREVMGRNPNYDLFRAVHVADSEPLSLDALRVHPVDVFPTGQGGGGVVVDAEVIRDGMTLQTRLTIDNHGFVDEKAAQKLDWRKKDKLFAKENLALFGRAFAEQRLREELAYYKSRHGAEQVNGFYRSRLAKEFRELGENQFMAQIGWGTGWNSKTLNDLLTGDKRKFAELVSQYRMTRKARDFRPGDTFPKSRHLLRHRDQPIRPMGWIKVTINE